MTAPRVYILPVAGLAEPDRLFLARLGPLDGPVLCHEGNRAALPACGRVETFGGGNLAPCRTDLADLARRAGAPSATAVVVAPGGPTPPYVLTALSLMGFERAARLDEEGESPVVLPRRVDPRDVRSVLVKAHGGIGNVVMLSFLARASADQGWETWFCPTFDQGGGSLADAFRGTLPGGVRVVGPEELDGLSPDLCLNVEDHANRREEDMFHAPYRVGVEGHGPGFAARFFANVTGREADPALTFVGCDSVPVPPELRGRVVVCPGSKVGWDSKRWPHMDALLRRLENPVVLCRPADLEAYARLDFLRPIDAPGATFVTDATLAGAVSLLRAARGVVANDCGLAHLAAAAGAPTLVLFGPSSLVRNRPLNPAVRCLSLGLDCQPCQGRKSGPGWLRPGEFSCELGYACLRDLSVDRVLAEARTLFNANEVRA
ncbi:glycosyltransferase family 9 protein [Pseudodesulfovibrio sp.]|uniref:glycosyltransferase family 9 protein n=1 Tax=Pseudodesulfovibrio sp. TaxID=2035812 RepID=UPI002607753F|nr:glycosyltransferase family 9 protein [Pseudodesulfovibrio sp.]MDD3312390.1 glycosyltransferase family 9 protein [Pseudodesulfovibrio sp.]